MTATRITAYDPCLYNVALPLMQTFYPLGFPVKLHTNSEQIRDAAREVWGQCEPVFEETPLQLRFAIDASSTSERPRAVMPRAQGNLFSAIHSAENYYIADLSRGFAYGWFTPSVVCDHAYFRYHFLEAAAYVMLNALYLTPIHAACVGLNGAGIVLCGPSGAGKTSLAFACARKGWEFICDDASHLVRNDASQLVRRSEDARLIVGKPHQIRFRESARALFPELAARGSCLRANGKMDIEAPSHEVGIEHIRSQIQAVAIVFLNRGPNGTASLRPYSQERAREFMEETICLGEEPTREAQRRSLDRFLELPVFELTYSDLDCAERCLRSFLEQGDQR